MLAENSSKKRRFTMRVSLSHFPDTPLAQVIFERSRRQAFYIGYAVYRIDG